MKNQILKISILPLAIVMAISLADFQPDKKDKGNKNPASESKGNQGNGAQDKKGKGNSENFRDDQGKGNNGQGKGKDGNWKVDDGRDKGASGNLDKKNDFSKKVKDGKKADGKFRKENVYWDRDESVVWGFENYSSRKRPKDFKKVSVCHNTGNNEYPVTINVSENALKAHLNHGDQVGTCRVDYSDRWPANFIRSRENVYNTYENTWETMSYSESLLRFAAERLLGIKSTFAAQRPTLNASDIERRERLILDLENNVNSLENQLAISKQRTAGININVNL